MAEAKIQNVSKLGIASVTLKASLFPKLLRYALDMKLTFDCSARCIGSTMDFSIQGPEWRPKLLQRRHIRYDEDAARKPQSRPRAVP